MYLPLVFIRAVLLFMMLATFLNYSHSSAICLMVSGKRSPTRVIVLLRYTFLSTFTDVSVYGDRGRDDISFGNHLGLTQVHAEAYWRGTCRCACCQNRSINLSFVFLNVYISSMLSVLSAYLKYKQFSTTNMKYIQKHIHSNYVYACMLVSRTLYV